ncbi:hypothetical protein KUTeg_009217 [Tegillarca granosa]|uniref:Oxysterol-binding protein n=1 Tax=Tegillarca granosa TaxID=220873 RepID=A0ABQ9F9E1_TEGGR|nr:hypothetical protein KUTeg_009217 [Tegillarca granosa]
MLWVEWYLSSFHAGRQGSVAKKPYNPIIGETFHCSWRLSPTENGTSPQDGGTARGENTTATENGANDEVLLTYCAEQVSHHPPISAFYFECPDKQICMNASIYTKSSEIELLKLDEEYIFGLPSAYARSILTYPWAEMGDKITFTCPQTNVSANITFHTKGETKSIDVNNLEIMRKRVRPLKSQGEFESRKLWQHLEERQREGERHRKETQTAFPTKYFHKEGDAWIYNSILQNENNKQVS